jgi:hypothetical protein
MPNPTDIVTRFLEGFRKVFKGFLNKTTITEHEIASRIAKTIDPNTNDTTDDPLVQLRIRQKSKWIDNLIIHYKHEARFVAYKKDIHQLWNHIFRDTPVLNTKLVIGHRNTRNLTKTLVHRRPHYKSASLPTITNQNQ